MEILEIAVDTGNKNIKSENFTFTSGLTRESVPNPLAKEILFYNGDYYTLSEKRTGYKKDKFKDETFFVLTLFAIAKELVNANKDLSKPISIALLLGLPPGHFQQNVEGDNIREFEAFEKYFSNRGEIKFNYAGKDISIVIEVAKTFVQGYSAIFPLMLTTNIFKKYEQVTVIDLGGYTGDFLTIKKKGGIDYDQTGTVNLGVIPMFYRKIIKTVDQAYGFKLEENNIDSIVLDHSNCNIKPDLFAKIKTIIDKVAEDYIQAIFDEVSENGINLGIGRVEFCGGGSILLKEYIEKYQEKNHLIGELHFIPNINANCIGYKTSYREAKKRGLL